MKKNLQQVFLAASIFGLVLVSCKKTDTSFESNELEKKAATNVIKDQYIILLDQSAVSTAIQSRVTSAPIESQEDYAKAAEPMNDYVTTFMKNHNMDEKKVIKVYTTAVNGFAATLTKEEVAILKNDPLVTSIEQNEVLKSAPTKFSKEISHTATANGAVDFTVIDGFGVAYWLQNPQLTSLGIAKAKGSANGTGKVIYIIDTGVDPSHPDLNVDRSRSANFITRDINDFQTFTNPGLLDLCGHGTACAGFAAAKNNGNGVIGVAAGATVVGVKVLYKDPNQGNTFNGGIGSYADIISGVDYVAAIAVPGQVCNLSLGGPKFIALNNAIINLANKGVYVTIAAGNNAINTANVSPASTNHPRVFTVSAVNDDNTFTSYSNFGADVDYAQVGLGVSTLPFRRIIFGIQGTSFAAPVLAGILAITKTPGTNGVAVNDPDGNPDPIAALY
jgi:hypothetical protein